MKRNTLIMVMVMYLYTAHITWSHDAFIILLWGKIGHQHVKAPLAVVVSPYFDLTHPPTQPTYECERQMKSEIEKDHQTGDHVPFFFRTMCGFVNVPQTIRNECFETGPTIYRPYLRRLESLTICRCHYKGGTFSSLI